MATLASVLSISQDEVPAVIIPGKEPLSISHHKLRQQVELFQQELSQLGIPPGVAVSLCLPNSLEFIVAFLGVALHRAIAAPLNPAYKEAEIDDYVTDLGSKAIIISKGNFEKEADVVRVAEKHEITVFECHWNGEDVVLDVKRTGSLYREEHAQIEEAGEEDVALVLHTSGTTGRPKAVPLSHKNLCASIGNIRKTYNLKPKDRTMLIMPLFHIHGLVAGFLSPLQAGSAIIVPVRLLPSFWQDFERYEATWYTATPTMHKTLLSFPTPPAMPAIRFIRSCSSPLSPKTLQDAETRFGAPVLEAYAMTEASHQICSNPVPPAPHIPGSVGFPHGDIELRIVDGNGDVVPRGTKGEVCIRGPSITKGYLGNAEANASASTEDGFFRTGDYGKEDESGRLFLTGRIKEFINKGGEKISPVELDHIIGVHPMVADVVAFAIHDDMYGQDVGAAVCLHEGSLVEKQDLQKWVRERIAAHKVPKKIWFTLSIPKTATGKVNRKLVAETMVQEKS